MVDHVILHIGADKTGSTSIQATLDGYDDGTAFWAPLEGFAHHMEVFIAFDDPRIFQETYLHLTLSKRFQEVGERNIRRRVRRNLSAILACGTRKTVVFSGEGLMHLRPSARHRVLNFIRSFGCRVTVIAYVRDPLSYAASGAQQRIKNGGMHVLPKKLSPAYSKIYRVFKGLGAPDRLIVKEFARPKLEAGDVVQDFCAELGLEISDSVTRNEGFSLEAVRVTLALNRAAAALADRAEVKLRRRQLADEIGAVYSDGQKLDPQHFATLAEYSETANLKDVTGIDFTKTCPSGHPDLEGYLTDVSGLDLAPLVALMDRHKTRYEPQETLEQNFARLLLQPLADAYEVADAKRRPKNRATHQPDTTLVLPQPGPLAGFWPLWFVRTLPLWSWIWHVRHWSQRGITEPEQ